MSTRFHLEPRPAVPAIVEFSYSFYDEGRSAKICFRPAVGPRLGSEYLEWGKIGTLFGVTVDLTSF
jgi:hypothetical protein